jgi:hypothetical protein
MSRVRTDHHSTRRRQQRGFSIFRQQCNLRRRRRAARQPTHGYSCNAGCQLGQGLSCNRCGSSHRGADSKSHHNGTSVLATCDPAAEASFGCTRGTVLRVSLAAFRYLANEARFSASTGEGQRKMDETRMHARVAQYGTVHPLCVALCVRSVVSGFDEAAVSGCGGDEVTMRPEKGSRPRPSVLLGVSATLHFAMRPRAFVSFSKTTMVTRLLILGLCWARKTVVGQPNATWDHTSSSNRWSPRELSGAVVQLGAQVMIVGGTNTSVAMSDVWASPDGVEWSLRTGSGFPARLAPCIFAASGTRMFVAGGVQRLSGSSVTYMADVWASPDGFAWSQLTAAAAWSARFGHSCIQLNNNYLLLGGFAPSASNDVFLSADGDIWTPSPAQMPWAPRGYTSLAIFNGRLWMAGGSNLVQAFSDVWTSADGNSWVEVTAAAPWTPRGSACLVSLSGVLWLLGGTLQRNSSTFTGGEVWRTDSTGKAWQLVESDAAWGPRSAFGCIANPAAATVMILGGLVQQPLSTILPAAPQTVLKDDVWTSTANLLCEEAGVVCSTHGICAGPPTGLAAATGPWAKTPVSATVRLFGQPGPLPFNCTCDVGFIGGRCQENFCNPRTCIHGSCANLNATTFGRASSQIQGGQICVCDDPTQWTGPSCDVAVCAPGCSPDHGSCSGAPGSCTCQDGWLGDTCSLELTAIRAIGRWVDAHVAQVYVSVTAVGVIAAAVVILLTNIIAAGGGSRLLSGTGPQSPDSKPQMLDLGEAAPLLASRSRHGAAVSLLVSPIAIPGNGGYGSAGRGAPAERRTASRAGVAFEDTFGTPPGATSRNHPITADFSLPRLHGLHPEVGRLAERHGSTGGHGLPGRPAAELAAARGLTGVLQPTSQPKRVRFSQADAGDDGSDT